MAERIFLKCSAKAKTFDNGGTVINIGIKAEDIAQFVRKYTNERGYVNIVVAERRETGQYGDSHTVYLDTYTPKTGAGAREDAAAFSSKHGGPVDDSEIPF